MIDLFEKKGGTTKKIKKKKGDTNLDTPECIKPFDPDAAFKVKLLE